MDARWWTHSAGQAGTMGPQKKRAPREKESEMDKACRGFNAEQAEAIRMARQQPPDDVARDIEQNLNPPPPRRGGGAPGRFSHTDGDKRVQFRKMSTGVCTVTQGGRSLFEEFTKEDAKMQQLSGMRRNEVAFIKSKLEEFSVDGEFNQHRFGKVMRHYGISDHLLLQRFFELYQIHNGRELVVPLPNIVEALCVFKNGTREQQLTILFRLIDVDGSQTVTAMELYAFISLMKRRLKAAAETAMEATPGEKNSLELEGSEGMSIVDRVRLLFAKLDADDGGDVNLEEFVGQISANDELWDLFSALNPFTKMLRIRSFKGDI